MSEHLKEITTPTHKRSDASPLIDAEQYQAMYQQSIEDPESFWAEQAKAIDWMAPWSHTKHVSFKPPVSIKWFEGAKLNACVNCVDRHLPKRANQTAIIWEANEPGKSKTITYAELHEEVCRFANVLKAQGVRKGDCVTIYMPMILEAAYAMLACARIGAMHSVVFGGFSAEALAGRIQNGTSRFVITADSCFRGEKEVRLKDVVDEAVSQCTTVKSVIVVQHTEAEVKWVKDRDHWYHNLRENASTECNAEQMDAEDPLFILYTSGSTGKPKGLQHTTGGYMVYTAATHRYTFDYQDGDVYWCTADVGWITGHSYIVYGPLANGATTLMFEGVPTYPDASRFWQIVDEHKVNIFYTAPTAIRALMGLGDKFVKKTKRSSLRLLGSVGEPINPEAWKWYYDVVGDKKCPIVDTWWQTETGGFLITPLPYAMDLKAGSASLPFFGIEPAIVDNSGNELEGEAEGNLCIKTSWPGQARTVFGNHQRFADTYFSQYPGMYFSGDGARRDADGYYWITGRVDDVLNVSGHRMGTAEIESALVAHDDVAEAAVVGYPHDVKGEGIYAYVTLKQGIVSTDELGDALRKFVTKQIGAIAKPDFIHFTSASGLPKTRSGKIMRRILRKIAANDYENLGDTNTLLNPEAVKYLTETRLNK